MRDLIVMSDEQTACLDAEGKIWLDCGRSAQPLDRDRSADAIRALYAAIGSPTPAVLFFSSPALCVLAAQALREGGGAWSKQPLSDDIRLGPQMRSQLCEQLGDKFCWQPAISSRKRVRPLFRRPIEVSSRSQVWAQVWDQLCTHLDSRLDRRIEPSLRIRLESTLRETLWMQRRSRLWSRVAVQLEERLRPQVEPRGRFGRRPAAGNGESHRDDRERRLLEIRRHEALLEEMENGIRMPAPAGGTGSPALRQLGADR